MFSAIHYNPISMPDDGTLVTKIADELERIFRYMLPGIGIVFAFGTAYPSWFCSVQYGTVEQFAVLAAVALFVGNTWYVAHRYSLHQLIDWGCYRIVHKKWSGYCAWLAEHVSAALHYGENDNKLRKVIEFRSAQVILLFIASEIAFVFALRPEEHTFWQQHAWPIRVLAVISAGFATFQQLISYKLDEDFAQRHGILKPMK